MRTILASCSLRLLDHDTYHPMTTAYQNKKVVAAIFGSTYPVWRGRFRWIILICTLLLRWLPDMLSYNCISFWDYSSCKPDSFVPHYPSKSSFGTVLHSIVINHQTRCYCKSQHENSSVSFVFIECYIQIGSSASAWTTTRSNFIPLFWTH